MTGGVTGAVVGGVVGALEQAGVEHDIAGSGTITGSADLVISSSLTLPQGTLQSDPKLGVMGDYGGQTLAYLPQAGSPAINAGSNPRGTRCDQRGGSFVLPFGMTGVYERQAGVAVDIGAIEVGAGDRLFADGFEAFDPFSCYPA